jgi:adenosylcobyric acid synthase
MSLNSYATPEGFEIGRAQAVQAEAAGVPCHTDMNPLLLKPSSERVCQVVLNGKPTGNRDACQYFKTEGRDFYREQVHAAFNRLNAKYNPIVLEGAGSIAEINLRATDLVNMPMAVYAGADVILVADIDRGGVFAAVYGSILLLDETERAHIKGIIINKFRGDIRLFQEGIAMLEKLCGIPVLGVIPYYTDIFIEEEDSVSLQSKPRRAEGQRVGVAVVRLRHLSNFTDFNRLEHDPRVDLFYTDRPGEVEKADIVILPGTKNTLADLDELHRNGMAQSILQAHRSGSTVIGICGGYQMMGRAVADPHGIEGPILRREGLGLLPIETTIENEKVTRQVTFRFNGLPTLCTGYEIHMGTSVPTDGNARPLNRLVDEKTPSGIPSETPEGCFVNEKCFGTYLHGLLDNPAVIDYILNSSASEGSDWRTFKEAQYDKLADHVRRHVDMESIYHILKPL